MAEPEPEAPTESSADDEEEVRQFPSQTAYVTAATTAVSSVEAIQLINLSNSPSILPTAACSAAY